MDDKHRHELFERLLSSINKVFFTYNISSASFTYINDAFSQIWQQTPECAMADPRIILNSIHPEDKDYIINEFEELVQGIPKHKIEFRILRPDQSIRYLLLYLYLVTNEANEQTIAGLVDDITVVKEYLRDLERHGAKKNSILEILSHDLAGPLNNIEALAEALSESLQDQEDESVHKIIEHIQKSTKRSVQLIRDFVQQEFLESSSVELFTRRFELVAVLIEVIEQYKGSENHIKKEIRFSSSHPKIYASIDHNKFMQVINNLISNSIKFTHDGGIIAIDITEKDHTILITLQDNGIGIPKQYHAQLFQKFTRARRPGLKGEPSTGLGMSLIKTIIDWHKGKIWFESEENVGTTFYIEIPKE